MTTRNETAKTPAFAAAAALRRATTHANRNACTRRRRAPRAEFAQSATLLQGLNLDHVRELAALVTVYGKETYYTPDALTSVRATQLDERGLALEAVMCDGDGCVCSLETLSWPDGHVQSAEEALSALRFMIEHAGLDGSVLRELEAREELDAR